ncbi:MAG: hypothetical protein NTY35_09460 [Planctomycetota bacterium]|nr:hypothetical protein [Planctomycetota bacterium]
MSPKIDPQFAAEFARTLRDEIGANSLYRRLARHDRDAELVRLLQAFVEEGEALETAVRELMLSLGARGRERSVFRWFSARCWGLSARLGFRRFVLRLCVESEEALARRYAGFAHWLARGGETRAARSCEQIATRKAARASALRAWVPR